MHCLRFFTLILPLKSDLQYIQAITVPREAHIYKEVKNLEAYTAGRLKSLSFPPACPVGRLVGNPSVFF
jgi:hypothetical protein